MDVVLPSRVAATMCDAADATINSTKSSYAAESAPKKSIKERIEERKKEEARQQRLMAESSAASRTALSSRGQQCQHRTGSQWLGPALPVALQLLVECLERVPDEVFTLLMRSSALRMLDRAEDIDEDTIATVLSPLLNLNALHPACC